MGEIEIRNLRKVFDTPHGEEIAVDGINLHIEDNEFVTLVGPSGCGKTTTLRCVAGLETPTSGSILLNGRDITELPPNKRDISMMFQSIALYPHMKVRENIGYPLKVDGVPKEDRDEPVEEVAQTMQIEEMLDKHPGDLSGGQRQRAALSRTVVQEPGAFLMDEPLSDLDAKLKVETRKEIQKIHKRIDKPILYVTHDQEEAMTMSDKIAVMNDGQIEQFAAPEDLFHRPNNTFIGQFIGQHGMNILNAEITATSGTEVSLSVYEHETTVQIGEEKQSISSGEVDLGIRPENTVVKDESEDGIPGTVQLLETFGEQTVATIDVVGRTEPVYAVVDTFQDLSEGTTISMTFEKDRVHLFDPDAGDVLAHTGGRIAQKA